MITIFRGSYMLLLSYNPCDVFDYFNVAEMHGLNAKDCAAHENTTKSAYIAGWSNFVPKESGEYTDDDPRFVFINLSRCTDDVNTFGLIMHELMHHSFFLHDYNMDREEEIITWAEEESYEVFNLVKPFRGKVIKQALNPK
jgi:hypothetical protein